MINDKESQIRVTVQDVDRMTAISNLSIALRETAKALSAVPQVTIANNVITGIDGGTGITVDTERAIDHTEVVGL